MKKIIFTNAVGQMLTVDGKLPEEATFADVVCAIDVYNTKAKVWFSLVLSWKRIGNFPKGAAFNKSIDDIHTLLKD